MDPIWAALLGALQGLTEFLPISSSGHLALVQNLIPNFQQPGLLLDVLLHVGTLLVVLWYYRRDVLALAGLCIPARWTHPEYADTRRLFLALVIGTLPAVAVAVVAHSAVESFFEKPRLVGVFLWLTAIALVTGERLRRHPVDEDAPPPPTPWQALGIGCAQAVALAPGVSRSGMTIAAGMLLGLAPLAATRFALLLVIPATVGAVVFSVATADMTAPINIVSYVVGPVVAAAVGYGCLTALVKVVATRKLTWFAGYCACLGAAAIILF